MVVSRCRSKQAIAIKGSFELSPNRVAGVARKSALCFLIGRPRQLARTFLKPFFSTSPLTFASFRRPTRCVQAHGFYFVGLPEFIENVK